MLWWLVTGNLYDNDRFVAGFHVYLPVVTVLVLVGIGVCIAPAGAPRSPAAPS